MTSPNPVLARTTSLSTAPHYLMRSIADGQKQSRSLCFCLVFFKLGAGLTARVISVERAGRESRRAEVGAHFVGGHKKLDEVYELPQTPEKSASSIDFFAAQPDGEKE